MTEQELNETLANAPKGANLWVTWERPVKLKKAYQNMPFTKKTTMLCRIGVAYDNKKQTQEGRENGELPAQNAGLNGFEWVEFPMTLRNLRNEKLYLRLESGTFKAKTTKEYFIDGQLVDFENWQHAVLASEKPKPREGQLTFNVCAENILAIQVASAKKQAEAENEGEAEAI
jgi:hypothetical protein